MSTDPITPTATPVVSPDPFNAAAYDAASMVDYYRHHKLEPVPDGFDLATLPRDGHDYYAATRGPWIARRREVLKRAIYARGRIPTLAEAKRLLAQHGYHVSITAVSGDYQALGITENVARAVTPTGSTTPTDF